VPRYEWAELVEARTAETVAPSPTDAQIAELIDTEIQEDPTLLIQSPRPTDRLRAIELAAQSGDILVDTIIKALADPAPEVRRRAAFELGRLNLTGAIPALEHAVQDPDESVRVAVVGALASIQVNAAVPGLVTALQDASEEVREVATAELVQRQSDDVARWLGRALASRTLRYTALEVLTRMGATAVEPLVDLLVAGKGVRHAIGAALNKMTGPDTFTAELSVMDAERRIRAVHALAAMGGATAVDALIRTLSDPEPEVRLRAAEFLGQLGDGAAGTELERAEYDPVPEVAAAARTALARVRRGDSEAESARV
jgi:HEAT repeat protein